MAAALLPENQRYVFSEDYLLADGYVYREGPKGKAWFLTPGAERPTRRVTLLDDDGCDAGGSDVETEILKTLV